MFALFRNVLLLLRGVVPEEVEVGRWVLEKICALEQELEIGTRLTKFHRVVPKL